MKSGQIEPSVNIKNWEKKGISWPLEKQQNKKRKKKEGREVPNSPSPTINIPKGRKTSPLMSKAKIK
jgi:hypothetical protein